MRRSRGWILIAVLFGLALLFVAWDVMDYAADTKPFKTAPLGQRWFELHKNSLLLVQPAIERHIAVWLWPPFQWVLTQPAWLVPAALGVLGLVIKAVRRRR
jgi:hypothetical protein